MSGKKVLEYAENLLEAVNAAAARVRNAWLSFLGITAFLFITISSVTHTTLLLDTPVRLPLFQVNMRAYAFFLVAPVIYVFVHLGVLVQHRTLRAKLEEFSRALQPLKEEQARQLRLRLSIYTYAQFMAGGERGGFVLVVAIIAWLTLVGMPLLLLAYFQASFLPYHSNLVTWANRLTLTADAIAILLIGLFRLRLREPGEWRKRISSMQRGLHAFPRNRRDWSTLLSRLPRAMWKGLHARLSGCPSAIAMLNTTFVWLAIFYAFLVATIPGDAFDRLLCGHGYDAWCIKVPYYPEKKDEEPPYSRASALSMPPYLFDKWEKDYGVDFDTYDTSFFLTAWLFERGINYITGKPNSPLGLARNLIITNTVINREGRVSFRGRDFRRAIFFRVIIRNADFIGADLFRASFLNSDLTGSRFGCDIQQHYYYYDDVLLVEEPVNICTNFNKSHFINSILDSTHFSINVVMEDMISSNWWDYKISFDRNSLKGAKFVNCIIANWSFEGANLSGAEFRNVSAQFVDFSGAKLWGAAFINTELEAANFTNADLTGVTFEGELKAEAADFRKSIIWYTRLPRMSTEKIHDAFRAAHFSGLTIKQPTEMERTKLEQQLVALSDPVLRQHLQKRLAPVLDGMSWQGWSRSVWEALQEPRFEKLPLACEKNIGRRLLKTMELRAKVLAERFCRDFSNSDVSIFENENERKFYELLKQSAADFVGRKWDFIYNRINIFSSSSSLSGNMHGARIKKSRHEIIDDYLLNKLIRMKVLENEGGHPKKTAGFSYYYMVDVSIFVDSCKIENDELKKKKISFSKWKKEFVRILRACKTPDSLQEERTETLNAAP